LDSSLDIIWLFVGQVEKKNAEEHRQLLEKCAATALSSKLVSQQKGFFSKMVVDAVLLLDELLPLNMIGVKKVPGGALEVRPQEH
jgi:T-complex protein 1 subunit eta